MCHFTTPQLVPSIQQFLQEMVQDKKPANAGDVSGYCYSSVVMLYRYDLFHVGIRSG